MGEKDSYGQVIHGSQANTPLIIKYQAAELSHLTTSRCLAMAYGTKSGRQFYESSRLLCQRPSGRIEFLIRLLDIIGSFSLMVCGLPLIFIAALLIKCSSAGPVLYRQRRVGQNGKIFTIYKFRTMVKDAEEHLGPVLAIRNDDRVTPLGRILRNSRMDELPQLYNILKGDMSLVGPRPERPCFVKRYVALQGIRLTVRPGLTGLAQIRGPYDLRPTRKAKYDRLYIKKRSLLLNASILLRTVPVLLGGKGW